MNNLLSGYKTYIGIIAAGILGVAYAMGWVDQTQFDIAGSLILAWTGVALKHAWDKKTTPPTP